MWGHSYGANCAMGGAALTANVHHLVLYEPSLGLPYPPGSIERIEAALAADDPDTAIDIVLVELLSQAHPCAFQERLSGLEVSPSRLRDRRSATSGAGTMSRAVVDRRDPFVRSRRG